MDYEQAATFWESKDAAARQVGREAFLEIAEAFIARHRTCALATAAGEFVRCTPLDYTYTEGAFWICSEGGAKFRALAHNKRVCLAVFDEPAAGAGMGGITGLQVSGTASVPEPGDADYRRCFEIKGIPLARIEKLPFTMHVIKVVPERMDMISPAFKAAGGGVRQFLEFGPNA